MSQINNQNSSMYSNGGLHQDSSNSAGNNANEDSGNKIYEAIFDEASNAFYYWNILTGETSWTLPKEWSRHQNSKILQQPSSSQIEREERSEDQDRGTDSDWNTVGKVQTNWQGDFDADVIADPHPLQSTPNIRYSLPVASTQAGILADNNNVRFADVESDGDDSLYRQRKEAEKANKYIVDEMLETEDERVARKFDNMRKNGAAVLHTIGEWQQWQSPHGAVFYSKIGQRGGQWKAPYIFPEPKATHGDYMIDKKVNSSLKSLNIEYASPKKNLKERISPLSPPLGISASASMPNLPYILQQKGADSPTNTHISLLDRAFVPKSAPRPGDEDDFSEAFTKDNSAHWQSDGKDDGDDHERAAVDVASKRLKDIYKALRFRERAMDSAIQLSEVKRKADEAKDVWEKYLDSKAESSFNKEQFGGSKRDSLDKLKGGEKNRVDVDSDDEEQAITNFDALYARSIVVRQQWPWTTLVDVETDRTFYRNEIEDYFQYDPPDDVVAALSTDDQEDGTGLVEMSTSASVSQRSRSNIAALDGSNSGSSVRAQVPLRPTNAMGDRYKQELENRRQFLRSKLDSLLNSEPKEEEEKLDSIAQAVTEQSATKASKTAEIFDRISKQIEAKEQLQRQPSKAVYAPPTHKKGNRTSMFNIDMNNFVKKYNPDSTKVEGSPLFSSNVAAKAPVQLRAVHTNASSSVSLTKEATKDETPHTPIYGNKEKYIDIAWVDAQTLLKRLRWFSASFEVEKSRHKEKISEKERQELRHEPSSIQLKWSKIRDQMHADLNDVGHSGMILSTDLKEDMKELALLKAKRVGKNASLKELNIAAAIRRKLAHESKIYMDKVKSSLETLQSYIYEDEESIVTMLESEVFRRHTLEAAVLMKSSLVQPLSVRASKAYLGLPKYALCPQAAMSYDTNLPHLTSSSLPSRQWELLQDSAGRALFCEKQTGLMQEGEPFDIEFKRMTKSLKYERWYDFGRKNVAKSGRAAPPEIMSDPDGGLLFYCPFRKIYNWREQINVSYYDLAPDTGTSKLGKSNTNPVASLAKQVKVVERVHISSDVTVTAAVVTTDNKKSSTAPLTTVPVLAHGKRAPRHSLMSRGRLENRSGNLWANMNKDSAQSEAVLASSTITKQPNLTDVLTNTLAGLEEGDDEEDDEDDEESGNTTAAALKSYSGMSPSEIIRLQKEQEGEKSKKTSRNQPQEDGNSANGLIAPAKNPFENLFPNMPKSGSASQLFKTVTGDPRSAASIGKLDTDPLEFEDELTANDYKEYCGLIEQIRKNPNDIRIILDLAEFFLAIYLHKEALICLTRVLDLSMLKPLPIHEFATVTLMVAKLSARHLGDYRLLEILKETLNSCPDFPPVLCQAAQMYELINCDEAAEQLYIGAMLLDPTYAPALEGYSSMLIRQGNLSVAVRYLGRIDDSYAGYAVSRLRLGWSQELLGADSEVILLAYQNVLGLNVRNRPSVLALSALGHFYHVRGDMDRANDFYSRALMYDPNDASSLILSACAKAAVIIPGTYNKEISKATLTSVDSKFRRGIFFCQKSSSRWIALLSYAEFLMCCKKDAYTAEDVLWVACRHAVWPTIALIHHFQYMRGNLVKARRVIMWMSNRRRKGAAQALIRRQNIARSRGMADPEKLLFGETSAPDVIPDDIQRDIEESLALMIVEAYCSLEAKDFDNCQKLCEAVIESDKGQVAAHRLIALCRWHRNSRVEAIAKFEDAFRPFGLNNCYYLRSFSVACALMGNYSRAVSMMAAAVEIGPLNALSWRTLGIMMYLYQNDRDRCLEYFSRAFELSGELDLEAIRLKGQVLMELGKFDEARVAFRMGMRLCPGDSVLLASYALCLCALGQKSVNNAHYMTNYDLKFDMMDDLSELSQCVDPEELFEAAVYSNLDAKIMQRKKQKIGTVAYRSKFDSLGKGWRLVKNMQRKRDSIDETVKTDQDAPPNTLFWYGLYCLNKGIEISSPDYNQKAKALFRRAIKRVDYPPHPLALHMLGWMSELEGDLRAAERFYCHALQLEPVEPHIFLQLSNTIQKTSDYIRSIASSTKPKAQTKSKKKAQKDKNSKNTMSPDVGQSSEGSILEFAGNSFVDHGSGPTDILHIHKRMILHDRVVWLHSLRASQMKNFLNNIYAPGKFVHIESFWLENTMHAFEECDDWATLLKCSKTFRKK